MATYDCLSPEPELPDFLPDMSNLSTQMVLHAVKALDI